MARFYLSNIRSDWPVPRQEEALDQAVPGWRSGAVYRDFLSRSRIRNQGALPERDTNLLRANSRQASGESVCVASLTVLAWDTTDLMAVMMRLAARHETLSAIAERLEVDPSDTDLDALKAAFRSALRRFSAAGIPGGEASGRKRSIEAQAKIERMRPYWGLPSEDYPTGSLCREHGVSRPTAILYLGSRRAAQQRHLASLKIADSNRKRKGRGLAGE